MNVADFEMLSTMLKERSGLVLTKDKSYLLETRLMPVARRRGLKGLDELCANIKLKKDKELIEDVTEAMTTNESLFFRDQKPFDQFKDVLLPKLLASRASTRRIRIWSAACSSGQEPFSLCMLLKELQAKLTGDRKSVV